ncbi:hypothetical protein BH11PLA2_BH11PLA2_31450 [soil metagenome]
MNTWFTDIVRTTNERLFSESDLTRIMTYYSTVPARLKLSEELERLEPTLLKPLHAELLKRFPGRTLYSRRLVQDLVESLRHLNRSVLTDDLKLLRRPWVDHVLEVVDATGVDATEITDAYGVMREMLKKQLPKSAWEVLEPAYEDMLDALTRGTALAA